MQRRQEMADDIASIREEIQRLESLTPAETIDYAAAKGWR
jgi:hypothetical protein